MKLLLRHMPIWVEGTKYGLSFEDCNEAQLTRVDLLKERLNDFKDINQFVDYFFIDHPAGMVFKTFKE